MKEQKKDCIRDMVDSWRQGGSHSITDLLSQAGYHKAVAGIEGSIKCPEVYAWCTEQFGERHYVWYGGYFWFETDEDAMLFALRWG